MKRLLWPGILFLSTSWLYFIPIFQEPDYNIGIMLLILGIISCTFAFYKTEFKKLDKKYLLLLLPLILTIIIIPLPYNIGPIILAIAVILSSLCSSGEKNKNWLVLGITFSGVLLTLQTFIFPLYVIFVSHGHRVDMLSPIISNIGGILGLKTSLSNGMVFLQTYQQTWAVTTTWEKLGFFPWLNITIGAIFVFFFIHKNRIWKYLAGFFAISFIYLILRYILILFIFTQKQEMILLWDQTLLILSFIPFILLLMRLLPLQSLKPDLAGLKKISFNKKQIAAMIFAFIFMFSLVGAFTYQDPGTPKQGRILIDDVHSEWENATRPIDTEWYGMLSTYNYYSWADWFDKYYTVTINANQNVYDKYVDRNDKIIAGGDLTYNLLKNYDILILKCPTEIYSEEEVRDIVRFVGEGGGLYMIGDHTNVFGMNFFLNVVSENFGISFLTDSTYELGTGMTSYYTPGPIFAHPVVQNMEEFGFLTSCTITAPINSENIIIGNQLLGEPGTYSTENFFRESRRSLDIEYGLLLQVAAVKYGQGRVLAFTDSTCFSNFCMFMDGYKDFNLGVIEYLNRENTYSSLNTVFLITALISLAITLYILHDGPKTKMIFVFLLAGLLAVSCAIPIFTYQSNISYPKPEAHSDFDRVCFEQEHSDAIIQHSPNLGYSSEKNLYGTFFVWTQRVGLFPYLEKTLEDAMEKGDAVVIINPIESFTDEETDKMFDYVENGGRLLLMDSALNTESTANELLQNFGIWISYTTANHVLTNPDDNTTIVNDTTNTTISIGNITTPHLIITGGEQVFVTERNETSIAVVNVGDGVVVAVVDSYTFNDNVLGGTFTEPDPALRHIYNTEYYIFEELLFKNST